MFLKNIITLKKQLDRSLFTSFPNDVCSPQLDSKENNHNQQSDNEACYQEDQ